MLQQLACTCLCLFPVPGTPSNNVRLTEPLENGRIKEMSDKHPNLQLGDKFWRAKAQCSEYGQHYCIKVTEVARRLDLNYSQLKKEMMGLPWWFSG